MSTIVDYKIYGGDIQALEITLDPQEAVRAEVGTMMYMEEGIEMQTNMQGGLFGGLKRMVTGESFFITNFRNGSSQRRSLTFAAPYPGIILPIELDDYENTFICQKDSFLCAVEGVEVGIAFNRKIGAGLFGGEGFILQKLTGSGIAFVHSGGAIIKRDLAPGETLRVDTGCLVGFSSTVNYDIRFVGGFKNALFGGEGLFLATVSGPGTVYLQSLPLSKMADRILSARGGGGGSETSGLGDLIGGLVSGG